MKAARPLIRKRALLTLGFVFSGLLCTADVHAAPSPTITEEATADLRTQSAETSMVRELIGYLFTPGTDLGVDSTSQARWLTPELRSELEDAYRRCAEAAAAHPDERYDLPTNSDFYDSWDPPTEFQVLGSRTYGSHAFVDVKYTWGPDTNYPGDRRMLSYVLVQMDGMWKLDDLLTIRGEFASPGSLSASLREMPRY